MSILPSMRLFLILVLTAFYLPFYLEVTAVPLKAGPHDVRAPTPWNRLASIIVFTDYACPYCHRFHLAIEKFRKEKDALKRFRLRRQWIWTWNAAYRHLPILGETSVYAAKAVLAAKEQGQKVEWKLHDLLLKTPGELSEQKVLKLAAKAGADIKKLKRAMEDPELDKVLLRNRTAAKVMGIDVVPAFLVLSDGGRVIKGYISPKELNSVVRGW